MKKHLSIFLGVLLLTSSIPEGDRAIKKILIDGNEVCVLKYNRIRSGSDLSLSDLATDLHFIQLETNKECMIGPYSSYHVTDKYILAIDQEKEILLFSGDGKFLRRICRTGKGPQEFQHTLVTAVDEKKDILYVGDYEKSYFMSWDLTSGSYLGNIPKLYQGQLNNLIVSRSGHLVVSPVVGHFESGHYYLWEQDVKGNLIRQIEAPFTNFYSASNDKLLHFNGTSFNYIPIKSDTVFTANANKLIPSYIMDFGKSNPNITGHIRWKSLKYKFESERIFCATINTYGQSDSNGYLKYTSEILILDKESDEVFLYKKINNDFSGTDINLFYLKHQPNNTIHIVQSAVDFVEEATELLNEKNTDPMVRERLQLLLPRINVEDNPILIVGQIRK